MFSSLCSSIEWLTYFNEERTKTWWICYFIHSLIRRMNDVCVTDDNTYLFRDGACEKKKKERRKWRQTSINFFFSSFAFIRRKSLADDMIICLLSCVVTISLLMINGKTERKKNVTPEQGLEPWTLWLKATRSTDWATRATWIQRQNSLIFLFYFNN